MKKRWHLFLFIACLSTAIRSQAQDIIVNNDNDTIFCKILSVNDENIRYRIQNREIRTTNTLNLNHIASYQINDDKPEPTHTDEKKEPVLRIAVGGGYAGGLGEVQRTGDSQLDQLTNDLINGYNLEADFEYYFNWRQKDALNFAAAIHLNYINHHTAGYDVNVPNIGHTNRYDENQNTFYIAPAFVMRYDLTNWLFTMSVGYGVVFFSNPIHIDYGESHGSAVSGGSHFGIGADYKVSPNYGIGLRLSIAGGAVNSLNYQGTKVKLEQAMSASSWMISGILSFRTK